MKYQLVRTSPYLSGQVRWDLIVNPSREIGDVYIRPISDNIVYNGTGSATGQASVRVTAVRGRFSVPFHQRS